MEMIKRILWQPTGGYWLFWTSFIYLCIGMYDLFVYTFAKTEHIQAVWILIVSLPLWIKPLARKLNMKCFWEI